MNKLTEEEKLQALRNLGIEPEKLKQRNPLFFKNIMERIRTKCVEVVPFSTPWLDDPELARKWDEMEKHKKDNWEVKEESEMSKKDETKLAKPKTSKWNSRGKFRKS